MILLKSSRIQIDKDRIQVNRTEEKLEDAELQVDLPGVPDLLYESAGSLWVITQSALPA